MLLPINHIDLPQYWDGLVDPASITVQLTQIATSQDLMVDRIESGKRIIIKSGNGTAINCCYHIWANRIGEKLYALSPLKNKIIPVEIVSSHYVDPKGERVRS